MIHVSTRENAIPRKLISGEISLSQSWNTPSVDVYNATLTRGAGVAAITRQCSQDGRLRSTTNHTDNDPYSLNSISPIVDANRNGVRGP